MDEWFLIATLISVSALIIVCGGFWWWQKRKPAFELKTWDITKKPDEAPIEPLKQKRDAKPEDEDK